VSKKSDCLQQVDGIEPIIVTVCHIARGIYILASQNFFAWPRITFNVKREVKFVGSQLRANKMKLHWGYYCLILAIVLCLIQYYISLIPHLDAAAITMGIFRTHHIFEILGFFFLGLGVSRSTKNVILSQVIIWAAFLVEIVITTTYISTFQPSNLTGTTLLLNLPMFVSFYSYKIYTIRHSIKGFGALSEKLDKVIPILGLIMFQLLVQGAISLIPVEPHIFIIVARAIIFLNWLVVLFTKAFLSFMEIN